MNDKKQVRKYFCYGSNLLSARMKINKKNVEKFKVATLPNYKLSFSGHSETWNSGTANIEPSDSDKVIGVIWLVDDEDFEELIKQEKFYHMTTVEVIGNGGEKIECVTFVQNDDYRFGPNSKLIPSDTYLKVMIRGANENQFPRDYIDFLSATPTTSGLTQLSFLLKD